jgi:hypothetical protein
MDTDLEKINALIPIQQGVAGFNPADGAAAARASVYAGVPFGVVDMAPMAGLYPESCAAYWFPPTAWAFRAARSAW